MNGVFATYFCGLPMVVLHRKVNSLWYLVPLKEQSIGRELIKFSWYRDVLNSNFRIYWHKF